MRELRFRVWDGAKFVYYGWEEEFGRHYFTGVPISQRLSINAVFESTEQYTGLEDDNGEEIYEGDIVQLNDTHVRAFRRVIGYRECKFGYEEPQDESIWYSIEGRGVSQSWARWHVIGNIHDNPELMEAQQ